MVKKQIGFTLIELLVSTAITALALIGAYTMQNKLMKSATQTSDISQAVFLNLALLESISANPRGIPNYAAGLATPGDPCALNLNCTNPFCAQAQTDIRSLMCNSAIKQSSVSQVAGIVTAMTCAPAACNAFLPTTPITCDEGNCVNVTLVTSWTAFDVNTNLPRLETATTSGVF